MMLDEIQSKFSDDEAWMYWMRSKSLPSVVDAIEAWKLQHDPNYRRTVWAQWMYSIVERAAMWIAVAAGSIVVARVIWVAIGRANTTIRAAIARTQERSRVRMPRHRMRTSATFHLFCTMPLAIECGPCSICIEKYEPHSEVVELRCGHCFHSKCLVMWFSMFRFT